MIRTWLTKLFQFDFIADGMKISCSENDRDRKLYRNGNDFLLVDEDGGFILDQQFLDENKCFMEFPPPAGPEETIH